MNESTRHLQTPTSGGLRAASIVAIAVVTGFLLCAGSAAAQQQGPHVIDWGHNNPGEVSHFVVLISAVEGGEVENVRQESVGKPTPESNEGASMSVYRAEVTCAENEFLAVVAVGRNGMMSDPSGWQGVTPTQPGRPVLAN